MNKVNRLKDGNQIQSVLKQKNKLFSYICNIYYVKVNDGLPYKIAIIVSKKISKKAVIRNKVKRQIRAIINELNLSMLNIHIVIIAKMDWLNTDYNNCKKTLFKLFQKIGGSK